MVLAGVTQCRVHSPRGNEAESMTSWSLPVPDQQISTPTPFGKQYVLLHPRVAVSLEICDGDLVAFELTEVGETFAFRVHVHSGFGCLFLCGLNQAESPGASGCGFHINANTRQGSLVRRCELVRGYFYCADSQAHLETMHWGLMDGLEWACRLKLSQLCICGDSQVFMRQIATIGECNTQDINQGPRLRQLLELVHIWMVLSEGIDFTFRLIPRQENGVVQCLANIAINLREHATTCNWSNIDKLCWY